MIIDNAKEIIELKKKGKTLQEIADKFNCSSERIRQIIKDPKPKSRILKQYKCCYCRTIIIDIHYRKYCDKHSANKLGLEGKDYLRELVRIRDDHTCQMCKKKWIEGTRRFDVHHLDEENEGWDNRKDKTGIYQNDKQNFDRMITYCHKCHLNLPHVRMKMSLEGRNK